MVKNIVIVGGGSAGWMTAAHLSNILSDISITLVESPDVPIIGVGESTVPPIVDFMKSLGMDEKDWMPACKATYKSSICFRDFHGTDGKRMWFPFSNTWSVNGRPANLHWLYRFLTDKNFNDRFSIYDYCTLVPEICRQGKTVRSLPGSAYAYHLDAIALGQYLKKFSMGKGVRHVADTIQRVVQAEDGSIRSLELESGNTLEADLFVDCSGFRSLLIGQTLKETFEDYYDSLFNDKAIAMRLPFENREKEMVSYTMCSALSSGWVWTIPLYNRMGSGYVYSSKYLSADQAEAEFRGFLKRYLGGDNRIDDAQAKHLDIRVGKYRRTWVKNCVAIGLSAGFIEPLESTGLQIVQSQVFLLGETLRAGDNDYNCVDAGIYNKSITDLLDSIRDFLVCHYALTSREDTPYWHDVKYHTRLSEALIGKLALARSMMPSAGNLHMFDTGGALAGFGFNDGWYYILTGMNHLPMATEKQRMMGMGVFEKPIVDGAREAARMVQRLEQEKRKVGQLPSHYAFLRDNIYGGAEE